MKKAKPPGEQPIEHGEAGTSSLWGVTVHKPLKAACKHGAGDCEVCGQSDAFDKPHTTVGGRGLVARLRGKR